MTNAEHIIAWAESSGPEYKQLQEIQRRSQPDCRDGYITPLGRYYGAQNLVMLVIRTAAASGDMYMSDVTAESINEAVALVLAWKVEQ